MKNEAATVALLRYNAERSEQKRRDVQTALAELAEHPRQPINKSNVARRAGVSREFINSHPELGQLIETAARQARHKPVSQHHGDTTIRGLQAQNQIFAQEISRQKTVVAGLRSTIEELRRQRQLHLGAQLMASAVDPNTHAQLQLDHDRLVAKNAALQRRLDEQDRHIAALQDDLAASRQAHVDDIARLTAGTNSPVIVIRHQP